MKRISRRNFLSNSLGAATALGALSAPAIGLGLASPTEQIGVAVIGLKNMGGEHLRNLVARPKLARVVRLCDVDASVLQPRAQVVKEGTGQTPALGEDFRRVLDDASVNAVVVATPHHWHVPIALQALVAGKDVYLEKPASHVFEEGRLLADAAKKYKRVFQHGTQTRSSPVTTRAREVLASGILGDIRMSKAWNVQKRRFLHPRPDSEAPPGVNYDMWLGPAPARPFNENRFHITWRQFRDYGNGDIGDDGVHDIDIARWFLGVSTHPVRITAHGSRVLAAGVTDYPDNMSVAYQYDDGRVVLYEDRMFTPYGLHGYDSGNAFYGTEGYMIFSRREYFQVYLGRNEEKGPDMKEASPRTMRHMENFLDGVRTRKETIASAREAHLTCGLVHLGEVALRVGRVLHFDPKNERVLNDPEAQQLLSKEYRKPWGLPPSAGS